MFIMIKTSNKIMSVILENIIQMKFAPEQIVWQRPEWFYYIQNVSVSQPNWDMGLPYKCIS